MNAPEFVEKLRRELPDIADELDDPTWSGQLHLQTGVFARYTQEAIDDGDEALVQRCFLAADECAGQGDDAVRNAIGVSFLARLSFQDGKVRRRWAWDLLTDRLRADALSLGASPTRGHRPPRTTDTPGPEEAAAPRGGAAPAEGEAFDRHYARLLEAAAAASALLRRFGEERWARRLDKDAAHIALGDGYGIDHLLTAFGTMGSLNDLVIHPANGHPIADDEVSAVNERLSELVGLLYHHALEMRRELP